MKKLRQSTASQEVMIGPFLDTNGAPVTGLTIANTDIRLHKTGGTTFANKNSGGATHVEGGWYLATFDATDTDTAGPVQGRCLMAGALTVSFVLDVLPTARFDWEYAGGALPGQTAATVILSSTAQAGATSTITLNAGASATDDFYRGSIIRLSATNQFRYITAYNGTTKIATVDRAWSTNPINGTAFEVLPYGPDLATPQQVTNAVYDESAAAHVVAGSFGERLNRLPNVNSGVVGGLPVLDANSNVSANARRINNVVVNGNGTVGTPWGP